MNNTLKLRSHDELIAYVPHMLGFKKIESSMVCLAIGGGPSARLDLPDSPEAMGTFLHQLSDPYLRQHPTRRVALIAFGEDGRSCLEALTALGETLVNHDRGPDVGPMLWVKGNEWFDVLTGTSGTVNPATRDRMAAEFALMGRAMPVATRADLAAGMQGDPAPVAEHLPAAVARGLDMHAGPLQAEVRWLGARLDQFQSDREYLSDVDAARVLAVIHDSGARNAAEIRMTRESAPVYSEFWHDLVRRAPSGVRDTPAAMLALSSYLEGKGAQAWVALDQISEARPPLADLVATALEQAIDPREWERALQQPAPSALMQQAALRGTNPTERRTHDQDGRNTHGVDGPESSAPGR
ncbi:hypothetical protein BJ993_005083 [Nocardioides aromaticivorans]|uniref:DUF4192 domain-containing protein n=1 Tax=Nocardioides aromaticivorans TaxID=200618 RepID=A0A7Y9ZLY0_9ACTN|nr:DUF4192 domain-containing protein [Nocardioides aromaticivorans]NYI47937.1 hypothetical protein [Nocardioides aromaticivorans]